MVVQIVVVNVVEGVEGGRAVGQVELPTGIVGHVVREVCSGA